VPQQAMPASSIAQVPGSGTAWIDTLSMIALPVVSKLLLNVSWFIDWTSMPNAALATSETPLSARL